MSLHSFKKVLPYAIVTFFGYVGFSMPLPILPEMFLDQETSILPSSYTQEWKMLLLGIVMAAYPLGQLIGAPILGRFSDHFGRKKVILVSLLGSMLGYIFTALATSSADVALIFMGLLFCGLCEGNVAIAQSVVADLSEGHEHKVSQFGWINLFVCFAFIIGPIIGGQLSDKKMIPWFSFAIPFWFAAFMTLCGIIIIILFSQETRKERKKKSLSYLHSLYICFRDVKLRRGYWINFFLALGYFSYFRFFPVYVESRFSFSSSMLGYTIAYGSIIFAICALLFLKPISKAMNVTKALLWFSLFLALTFFLVLWPSSPWSILWTLPPFELCLAVVMTNASVLVSNSAHKDIQGQALGVLTSVQVSAEFLTGILGGFVAGYWISFPMVVGAVMVFIATGILFAFRKQEMQT